MLLFGNDTKPEVAQILIQGYRAMSHAEKARQVSDLTRTVHLLAEARIRKEYPDATEREVTLRRAALTLGRDLVKKAFNWDSEREGW